MMVVTEWLKQVQLKGDFSIEVIFSSGLVKTVPVCPATALWISNIGEYIDLMVAIFIFILEFTSIKLIIPF